MSSTYRGRRREPWALARLAGLLLLAVACGGRGVAGAEDSASETAPQATASSLLPEALRTGPNHSVREAVALRGFTHVFTMDSRFGAYTVPSRRLLEVRAHEVETIARVVDRKGAPEFLRALGSSLASLPTAAVDLVLHPIRSAWKIGDGLGKTFRRVGDAFRSRPRNRYEDTSASNAFAGDEKRKLASDLKLDVYSTNPQVRMFLDHVASHRAAGNLTVDAASLALPVIGFVAVTTTKWRADVDRLLRDKTPSELDRHNAGVFRSLGIPRITWMPFLRHPWLSPRHETVIAGALGQMKGVDRVGAVLGAAATSRSEVGALFHEQQAILLAHHHTAVRKLVALDRVRHVVVATTEGGRRVAFLPADVVWWNAGFADLVGALRAGCGPSATLHLHVVGSVTARARSELEERGIEVHAPHRPGEEAKADGNPQPARTGGS